MATRRELPTFSTLPIRKTAKKPFKAPQAVIITDPTPLGNVTQASPAETNEPPTGGLKPSTPKLPAYKKPTQKKQLSSSALIENDLATFVASNHPQTSVDVMSVLKERDPNTNAPPKRRQSSRATKAPASYFLDEDIEKESYIPSPCASAAIPNKAAKPAKKRQIADTEVSPQATSSTKRARTTSSEKKPGATAYASPSVEDEAEDDATFVPDLHLADDNLIPKFSTNSKTWRLR
jgi:hypothetical protein